TFSTTLNVTITGGLTATAVYLTKPVIYTEQGTANDAMAINSVTFLRGPFQILDSHNFAIDGHTRIILFTSDLGLTQANLSDPSVLVVAGGGLNFPVENVGPLNVVPGLTCSYIVVKLPDGLSAGAVQLTVRLRGVSSDARTVNIIP